MQGGCLNLLTHLDPAYGGVATSLEPLCASTTAAGFPSSVAAFDGSREAVESKQVPVNRLSCNRSNREVLGELTELVRASEIVHIHGLWQLPTLVGGWMSRRFQRPYLISAHGMLESWALHNKRLKKIAYSSLTERRTLAKAACLRALTLDEVDDYRRFGLSNPVAIVPNGVSVTEVTPELFLGKFPALRSRRLALYLGRIHPKKGPDLLVKAWSLVASRFPDAQLVFAGADYDNSVETIRKIAAGAGMADQVTFAGLLRGEMKWSALAACSFFVLPSYSEGFSVAVLEALGSSKPVIITPYCHFPEVQQYRCGWVKEPQLEQIAEALTEALSSESEILQQMGERGRRLVSEQYDWNTIGCQMAAVYRWILGGPVPASVPIFK
jgi:glycosyltransferase involved in cell wall biosynthesis